MKGKAWTLSLRARAKKSKVGTSSGRVIGEHPKGKGV